jgi:hypothetical protein
MTEKEKNEIKEELKKRADKFLKPSKVGQTLIDKLKNKKEDKEEDKKEMMKGGMVKKYAQGGVATKKMMGGGMAMKYAKGGMANCGASVKASGGSRNK